MHPAKFGLLRSSVRHREVDVGPIAPALEVYAAGEDLLGGPPVLADQPAHVAQAVAGGEHPEGPLAEQEIHRLVLGHPGMASGSRPTGGRGGRSGSLVMPPRSAAWSYPSASISRASIPSATTTDALKSGYLSRVNCGVGVVQAGALLVEERHPRVLRGAIGQADATLLIRHRPEPADAEGVEMRSAAEAGCRRARSRTGTRWARQRLLRPPPRSSPRSSRARPLPTAAR